MKIKCLYALGLGLLLWISFPLISRAESTSIDLPSDTVYNIQYKINDQAWATLSSAKIIRTVEYNGKVFLELKKPYSSSNDLSYILLDSVVSLIPTAASDSHPRG